MLCSACFISSISMTSLATEWKEAGGKIKVKGSSGNIVSRLIENGEVVKNTPVIVGADYYYLGDDGLAVVNEWRELTSEEDGLKYWYYFGADGKAYRSRGEKASVRDIQGKKYIFNAQAQLQLGYINATGNTVGDDVENVMVEAEYYASEDGSLIVSDWHRYYELAEADLYSNFGLRYYREYAELWMYFDENGKKLKANDLNAAKTRNINGVEYAFDENGIALSGISIKDATVTNANNAFYRYGGLDNETFIQPNKWIFMSTPEHMSEDDYNFQDASWFRTNDSGTIVKNKIHKVYEKKYAFDRVGRMQTGFVVMSSDGQFVKQFDIDEFSADEFKNGQIENDLPAVQTGNLYLFSSDELNDGAMIAGRDVALFINGGEAVFGFKSSGLVHGAKGVVERVNNKHYIYGLRLSASPDLGYAVVKDADGIHRVVDEHGRMIRARNKVLKDKEGAYIIIQNNTFVARVFDGYRPRIKDGVYHHYDSSLRGDARWLGPVAASHIPLQNDDFYIYVDH